MWRYVPKVKHYAPYVDASQLIHELSADQTSPLLNCLLQSSKSQQLDEQRHQQHEFISPFTIVVGGVALGGSGKTQVVRYLVERLLKHGCQSIFILGHAYLSLSGHRKSKLNLVKMIHKDNFNHYGDEASMLAYLFRNTHSKATDQQVIDQPKVQVLVGGTWNEKWNHAKGLGAEIIISDGGLYTRDLPRHIGITVLSSYEKLRLLPFGHLTRPKLLWARSKNYIFWGTEDSSKPFSSNQTLHIKTKVQPQAFICLHTRNIEKHLPIKEAESISVVCGIAKAERFRLLLLNMGYSIDQWHQVRDHKAIPNKVIKAMNSSLGQTWVTTMKDAPKFIKQHSELPQKLWALDVTLIAL